MSCTKLRFPKQNLRPKNFGPTLLRQTYPKPPWSPTQPAPTCIKLLGLPHMTGTWRRPTCLLPQGWSLRGMTHGDDQSMCTDQDACHQHREQGSRKHGSAHAPGHTRRFQAGLSQAVHWEGASLVSGLAHIADKQAAFYKQTPQTRAAADNCPSHTATFPKDTGGHDLPPDILSKLPTGLHSPQHTAFH